MAKILITESVHPIGPELLTAAGHTVVYADRDMDVIRREIVDADAVLVRIIELPGSLLATAKNLKIVSKHGVGYDNIDLDYCKSHGIAVTITPNANSLSVAEHAFTLMLTLAKNIIPVSNEYRDGRLCCEEPRPRHRNDRQDAGSDRHGPHRKAYPAYVQGRPGYARHRL